jgi:hypothetical protein
MVNRAMDAGKKPKTPNPRMVKATQYRFAKIALQIHSQTTIIHGTFFIIHHPFKVLT